MGKKNGDCESDSSVVFRKSFALNIHYGFFSTTFVLHRFFYDCSLCFVSFSALAEFDFVDKKQNIEVFDFLVARKFEISRKSKDRLDNFLKSSKKSGNQ